MFKQFKEAKLNTFLTMFIVRKFQEDPEYFIIRETGENYILMKKLDYRPDPKTYKVISDNPSLPEPYKEKLLNHEIYFKDNSTISLKNGELFCEETLEMDDY